MTHGRRIALVAGVVALVIVGGSRPAVAAAVDVTNGELTYTAGVSIANALVVSLAAGTYTVDDAAESAFSLGAGAVAVGCLVVDANTVTCPEAAVNSLNVNVGDLADSVDLATIVDPATITGGTGNDVLVGGLAGDLFVWIPGSGSDLLDGKGGSDILLFSTANIAEHVTITASGSGFHVFRDVASIGLDAFNVEVLDMPLLGGDDTLDTVPLASTMQVLDGGAQSVGDVLNFDGHGACFAQSAGVITGAAFAPVLYQDFETVNVTGDCVPIFSDGFEDGTTDAWSLTVP